MPKKISRRGPFPTAGELRKSPAVHFHYYQAKTGSEKELLDALVGAAEVVEKEEGVNHVSVFALAHGKGPTYLLTLRLANPSVLAQLRKQAHLRDLGVRIGSLAERTNHATFSEEAGSRLG